MSSVVPRRPLVEPSTTLPPSEIASTDVHTSRWNTLPPHHPHPIAPDSNHHPKRDSARYLCESARGRVNFCWRFLDGGGCGGGPSLGSTVCARAPRFGGGGGSAFWLPFGAEPRRPALASTASRSEGRFGDAFLTTGVFRPSFGLPVRAGIGGVSSSGGGLSAVGRDGGEDTHQSQSQTWIHHHPLSNHQTNPSVPKVSRVAFGELFDRCADVHHRRSVRGRRLWLRLRRALHPREDKVGGNVVVM